MTRREWEGLREKGYYIIDLMLLDLKIESNEDFTLSCIFPQTSNSKMKLNMEFMITNAPYIQNYLKDESTSRYDHARNL